MINLTKFLVGVIINQSTLDHGQEITMIVTDDETYRTMAPGV